MSSESAAPIFVLGAPRSGTHLLRFCLSQHSRLHIGPETGFFIGIYGNRRVWRPAAFPRQAERIVDRLLTSGDPTMQDVERLRPELVDAVRRGPRDYRELAQVLLGGIAATAGKARWGEKTPLHVLYVREIKQLFPEAQILYVRRECRNTVASYLGSPLLPDALHVALAQVTLCVRAGELAVRKGWAHAVQYEELTRDPERALRSVSDYLGEPFEEAMLRPGMRDSSFDGKIMERGADIGIAHDPDEEQRYTRMLTEEQAGWVRTIVDGVPGAVPKGLRLRVSASMLRQWAMHRRNRMGLHDLSLGTRHRAGREA